MIFRDAHHALRWAYETSNRPVIEISSINTMRGSQAAGGMTPYDCHAQAALILSAVDRLDDPAGRECIEAKYGGLRPESVSCLMLRVAAALGTGVHDKRAIHQFLRSYFGARVGYRAVRKMLGCRDSAVLVMRGKVFDALDRVHDRAMAELQDRMERGGLIRREYAIA